MTEELAEKYAILQGQVDELMAKARLYFSQVKKDESRIPEVAAKFDKLSSQMATYEREQSLIEQEWDEINLDYGIT